MCVGAHAAGSRWQGIVSRFLHCLHTHTHCIMLSEPYLVDLVFTFHILLHVSQDFLEDICPVWTFYAGGWQIQELQLWQLIWQIAPKRSYILKSLVSSRKLRPWKPLSPSACLHLRAIPAFCFLFVPMSERIHWESECWGAPWVSAPKKLSWFLRQVLPWCGGMTARHAVWAENSKPLAPKLL